MINILFILILYNYYVQKYKNFFNNKIKKYILLKIFIDYNKFSKIYYKKFNLNKKLKFCNNFFYNKKLNYNIYCIYDSYYCSNKCKKFAILNYKIFNL